MPNSQSEIIYYCDKSRHLVCTPYTVENLHKMAETLGIKRCWYHSGASYAHYDIPKKRIAEIQAKCTVVSARDILAICKGTYELPASDTGSVASKLPGNF